ncbi:MAG: hypothetical protein ACQERF_10735, partial [Actinomycetota bacterium]
MHRHPTASGEQAGGLAGLDAPARSGRSSAVTHDGGGRTAIPTQSPTRSTYGERTVTTTAEHARHRTEDPHWTGETNPVDGRSVWVLPLQGEWIDNPVNPLPVEEIEACDPMPQYAMFVQEAELERLNLARTAD